MTMRPSELFPFKGTNALNSVADSLVLWESDNENHRFRNQIDLKVQRMKDCHPKMKKINK